MSSDNDLQHSQPESPLKVERVQTGIRIEIRMLKVLKALAEYHDIPVGELIEGIVLHAFEGKVVFTDETRAVIKTLKGVYGMDYDTRAAHHLVENPKKEEHNAAN